jgi:hypothetical protein
VAHSVEIDVPQKESPTKSQTRCGKMVGPGNGFSIEQVRN